jgi:hypothetical protein
VGVTNGPHLTINLKGRIYRGLGKPAYVLHIDSMGKMTKEIVAAFTSILERHPCLDSRRHSTSTSDHLRLHNSGQRIPLSVLAPFPRYYEQKSSRSAPKSISCPGM